MYHDFNVILLLSRLPEIVYLTAAKVFCLHVALLKLMYYLCLWLTLNDLNKLPGDVEKNMLYYSGCIFHSIVDVLLLNCVHLPVK